MPPPLALVPLNAKGLMHNPGPATRPPHRLKLPLRDMPVPRPIEHRAIRAGEQSTLQSGLAPRAAQREHQVYHQSVVQQSIPDTPLSVASGSDHVQEFHMQIPFVQQRRGRHAAQRELQKRLADVDRPRFYDEPAIPPPPPLFVQDLPAIPSKANLSRLPPAAHLATESPALMEEKLPAPWLPTRHHHILSPETSHRQPQPQHLSQQTGERTRTTLVLPKIGRRHAGRTDEAGRSMAGAAPKHDDHDGHPDDGQYAAPAALSSASRSDLDIHSKASIAAQPRRRRVPSATPSNASTDMPLGALLSAPETIRAIHDILYHQLDALRVAADARMRQQQQLTGMTGNAFESQTLEQAARTYCDDRSRGISVPARSLEGLRACCARCVPHPAVRIVQTLFRWLDFEQGLAGEGSVPWVAAEQLTALWLLLEWLMPPHDLLYPTPAQGKEPWLPTRHRHILTPPGGAKAVAAAAAGPREEGGATGVRRERGDREAVGLEGGARASDAAAGAAAGAAGTKRRRVARQAPQRDDDVPLLPPRMLLHVSAIPKLLASLGRRGLFRPGEAVPFLFQAAMQLVELDDKERPVVDFEELVLHWCVPWPSYRYAREPCGACPPVCPSLADRYASRFASQDGAMGQLGSPREEPGLIARPTGAEAAAPEAGARKDPGSDPRQVLKRSTAVTAEWCDHAGTSRGPAGRGR